MRNKLLLIALLAFACPLWAQRSDPNCGTASGTFGSFTMTPSVSAGSQACAGQTADTTNSSTETVNYNNTAGQLLVALIGSCDWQSVGGNCSGGPFTPSPLTVTDHDGAFSKGTVTVASGGLMTLTGGLGWGRQGCNWSGGCKWSGQTITVAGSSCTMTKPITMWLAQTSGCTVGTGESFVGPSNMWVCPDTSDIAGAKQAWCLAIAAATNTSDAITVHDAASSPPASLQIVVTELADSGNNFSIDYNFWPFADYIGRFESLGAIGGTVTQFKVDGTLSTTNEMVILEAVYQAIGSTPTTGWNPLMTGAVSPSGNGCGTGNCTNQVQSEFATFSSSGAISPIFNSSSANNEAILEPIAIIPSATGFTPTTSNLELANYQCGGNNADYCNVAIGSSTSTGMTLPMPLTNPSTVFLMEQYSTGTPSTPTFNGTSMLDCGPGAVTSGGGSHARCYYYCNTSNASEVAPVWASVGVEWYQMLEVTNSATCPAIDKTMSHGSQSSGSGGSVNATASAQTPSLAGERVLAAFDLDNGPAGLPGTNYSWVDLVWTNLKSQSGTSAETWLQTTATSTNGPATDCNGNAGCTATGGTGTSGDTAAAWAIFLKPPSVTAFVRHRGWVIQ